MTGADKLKLAYYRSFQGVFNVGERFMAWRRRGSIARCW